MKEIILKYTLGLIIIFAAIGIIYFLVNRPNKPVSASPIIINQSASTNTKARTLNIQQDGSATTTDASKTYPAGTFIKIVELVDSIGDVSKIPVVSCTKSISFGTVTTVTYNGAMSGDLECIDQNASDEQKDLADQISQMYNLF